MTSELEKNLDQMESVQYKSPMCFPLMDDAESFDNSFEKESVYEFNARFSYRYGEPNRQDELRLPFVCKSFQECVDQALNCHILDRKPLAIYLHEDNAVGWYQFPSLITNERVCDLLSNEFVSFPWDCSSPTRKSHIEEKINQLVTAHLSQHQLPCLLIIVKNELNKFSIADYLNFDKVDQIVDQLKTVAVSFYQLNTLLYHESMSSTIFEFDQSEFLIEQSRQSD